MIKVDIVNALSGLLSAGVGTFVGAYTAFSLERSHALRKELREHAGALRSAQFSIVSMVNCLLNYKVQVLDKYKGNENAYVAMKPYSILYKTMHVDYNSIAFILNSNTPQLLNKMMVAENSFETFVGVVEKRNMKHLEMQQIISKDDNINIALDTQLRDLASEVYNYCKSSLDQLKIINSELVKYIGKEFKDEHPLQAMINENIAQAAGFDFHE